MFRPAARYVLPEFTERTSSGTRTRDPYSKLLSERIVFLGTPVDDTAASGLGQAGSCAAALLAGGAPGRRHAL
ncbi:MAG TPA: ATP-dependent Clp protease proteolytic subunit, partial [Streptomyces sp.]